MKSIIGVANRWESILSKIPPWPGKKEPVSLIPFSLLWRLIKRSPKKASKPPSIQIGTSQYLRLEK